MRLPVSKKMKSLYLPTLIIKLTGFNNSLRVRKERDLMLCVKGGAMKPMTLSNDAVIYIFSRNNNNGGL
jgi:hypothetical protein